MAQVRFLDQVPVGVYEGDGGGGGGQSVNIYYSSSLVLANVPLINFTGSVDVYQQVISGSNGVTVKVTGFPYSGSATTKDYTFTTTENLICDILVVGGGGDGDTTRGRWWRGSSYLSC
jgi:hypothetical protein